MTRRECPACGAANVLSVREFVAVFDWRSILSESAGRVCDRLEAHGWRPESREDREDMARRWLLDQRHETDDRPAPELICSSCARPWAEMEVSGE